MSNVVVHDKDPVPMTGDVHDHPYNGSQVALAPDAPGYALTGIDPNGVAVGGWEIVLVNETAHSIDLPHDDTGSAEGNRLFFADELDHVLGPYEMLWAVYKETVPGRVGWWVQP